PEELCAKLSFPNELVDSVFDFLDCQVREFAVDRRLIQPMLQHRLVFRALQYQRQLTSTALRRDLPRAAKDAFVFFDRKRYVFSSVNFFSDTFKRPGIDDLQNFNVETF